MMMMVMMISFYKLSVEHELFEIPHKTEFIPMEKYGFVQSGSQKDCICVISHDSTFPVVHSDIGID